MTSPEATRVFATPTLCRARFETVKRNAAQYAALSRLLDEALELDESARVPWLAALPGDQQGQRPALQRMLTLDRAAANRKLKRLEAQLRSSTRAMNRVAGLEGRRPS
jgi:hypothetical protein